MGQFEEAARLLNSSQSMPELFVHVCSAERQCEALRDRLKEAATARKSYERLRERNAFGHVIGSHPSMVALLRMVEQVAPRPSRSAISCRTT